MDWFSWRAPPVDCLPPSGYEAREECGVREMRSLTSGRWCTRRRILPYTILGNSTLYGDREPSLYFFRARAGLIPDRRSAVRRATQPTRDAEGDAATGRSTFRVTAQG